MWKKLVVSTFHAVRKRIVDLDERVKLHQYNKKGDTVCNFDLIAQKIVEEYIQRDSRKIALMSEEGEVVSKDADFVVVCDPVDGSDNFLRGLPMSMFTMAVFEAGASLHLRNVRAAFVGNLFTGEWCYADNLEVAASYTLNQPGLHPSNLKEAFVTAELNHCNPPGWLGRLFSICRGVRVFGCASYAIISIASGKTDIHIDIRERLTPENFLAPGYILERLGGCLIHPSGHDLPPAENLQQRFSILAAGNRKLAEQVLALKSKSREVDHDQDESQHSRIA